MAECQRLNGNPANPAGEATWSNNDKLSPYTNNIIQVWKSGTGEHKDQLVDGYAYIKKQCMHCVDPNCVSVCPVQALTMIPRPASSTTTRTSAPAAATAWWAARSTPKYDYDNPFGAIHKCELCNQKGLERIDQGKLPGCVEVCPTGAVIFGTREALMAEAKRRLLATPGSEYAYPRQTFSANDPYLHEVPNYQPYVYGEKEGAAPRCWCWPGVPYTKLDMPDLPELSSGARLSTSSTPSTRGWCCWWC